MSENNKNNLSDKVMEKIRSGQAKMLPHFVFVLGSVLFGFGILILFGMGILTFNIFSFHMRIMRPLGFWPFFAPLPWLALLLGILAVVLGSIFLRKYDFSYRKNFVAIVVAVILISVLAGFVLEESGFNERPRPRQMMHMFSKSFPATGGEWIFGTVKELGKENMLIETKGGETKTIFWEEGTSTPAKTFKVGDFVRVVGRETEDGFQASRFAPPFPDQPRRRMMR